MIRLVRWDDVYLTGIDRTGYPWWGPRDEAQEFLTRKGAHVAKREARAAEGSTNIVVVRVRRKS